MKYHNDLNMPLIISNIISLPGDQRSQACDKVATNNKDDILMPKNPLHSSKPIEGHNRIENTSRRERDGKDLLAMPLTC